MESERENFKNRILKEMTVDYANSLEKNFDLAKQFIRITKEGKIDIKFKEKLTGKEQILLYLIGKLYAKEADLTTSGEVGNEELKNELGIPEGSLFPWLSQLRDSNQINQIKKNKYVYHEIRINYLQKILESIDKKLNSEVNN